MKSTKILIVLLLSFIGFANVQAKAQPEVSANIDFNTFYDDLSPYGRWIDHGSYGRVWIYNEPGFRPYYSNGHWDYTDYGWTWVSDYNWGWAPFHYGRWEEDPEFGWMWIPGYDWAPAWVTWSQDNDYYGWAPLGYGLDISVSIGRIPYNRWCFMPRQYITSPRIYDYCMPFERNRIIVRNTTIINNIYGGRNGRYMMGPGRGEVERITHSRIEPRRIDNNERFGYANRNRNTPGNYGRAENGRYGSGQENQWNSNRRDQNREDTRQRVFGNRQNDAGNGANRDNNTYQQRTQRTFDQGQPRPERQQQANPYQQQRSQRSYDQGQGRSENQRQQQVNPYQQQRNSRFQDNNQQRVERNNTKRESNVSGDQRNNDRQDSRQRVFGERRRG